MSDATPQDSLDGLRHALDGLADQPVADHVVVLGRTLDAIVSELDELARTIPAPRVTGGTQSTA